MCSATRLLIIDDDRELCELLIDYLQSAGFEIDTAGTAEEGVHRALTGQYAAAVLDVMLPGFDGFEVLRRIRAKSAMPILMLTARGDEVDRIVGLEVGADDYLPKPFNPRELVARLRAILRRSQADARAVFPAAEPRIVVGDLQLDPGARTVECGGAPIELTSTEFDLLEALVKSAGRVVPREDLSRTVFGRRLMPEDRSIDVHISNLRRKLGNASATTGGADRIKTLRGTGYIFALPNRLEA
jgi:two-component system, OmpR family, response regulator CpxR